MSFYKSHPDLSEERLDEIADKLAHGESKLSEGCCGLQCRVGGQPGLTGGADSPAKGMTLLSVVLRADPWSPAEGLETCLVTMLAFPCYLLATYVLMSLYSRGSPVHGGLLLTTPTLESNSPFHKGTCHMAVYEQIHLVAFPSRNPEVSIFASYDILNRLIPNVSSTIKIILIILIRCDFLFLGVPKDLCTHFIKSHFANYNRFLKLCNRVDTHKTAQV